MSDKTPNNKTKSLIEAANRVTNNLQEDCGCGCGGNSDPILSLDEDTQKFIESMELNESQQALLNEKMMVLNERKQSDIQAEIDDIRYFLARCNLPGIECTPEQIKKWRERLKELRELCPDCEFDKPVNPEGPPPEGMMTKAGMGAGMQMPKTPKMPMTNQPNRGMSL